MNYYVNIFFFYDFAFFLYLLSSSIFFSDTVSQSGESCQCFLYLGCLDYRFIGCLKKFLIFAYPRSMCMMTICVKVVQNFFLSYSRPFKVIVMPRDHYGTVS